MSNRTKRVMLYVVLIGIVISSFGCARLKNHWAAKGGIIGSYKGDYIVISQSGGRIMDVWKLKQVIVQNTENSDGWLFKGDTGNPIFIGGDAKVIRMSEDKSDWEKYHEYHMEFESQTYREKFNRKEETVTCRRVKNEQARDVKQYTYRTSLCCATKD